MLTELLLSKYVNTFIPTSTIQISKSTDDVFYTDVLATAIFFFSLPTRLHQKQVSMVSTLREAATSKAGTRTLKNLDPEKPGPLKA